MCKKINSREDLLNLYENVKGLLDLRYVERDDSTYLKSNKPFIRNFR